MMNTNQEVRVKYRHNNEIIARNTRSVVPRRDETVVIYEEDETGVPVNKQKYVVDGVVWSIADTVEEVPDVATIELITPKERREKIAQSGMMIDSSDITKEEPLVPEGVIEGIHDIIEGKTATKEELQEIIDNE